MANGGIKAFLNECESNLTYLNVYRKNHLKQILTLAAQSLAAISYEEALQAKAKYVDKFILYVLPQKLSYFF